MNTSCLISGSRDTDLKVWDLESFTCTTTLEGHEGAVRCVTMTPDGTRIISGSDDGTVKVWNLPITNAGTVIPGRLAMLERLQGSALPPGSWKGPEARYDGRGESHRLIKIGSGLQVELSMQLGPKTLAAKLHALPGTSSVDSEQESTFGGNEVNFYMPVPWTVEAVEAYVAEPGGREEPDVV
eukprot:scaffold213729_cov32-Prasinocladus_malaysianus.AAC.1